MSTGRRPRGAQLLRARSEEVWPAAPADQRGRRLSRDEEDDILGLGANGT